MVLELSQKIAMDFAVETRENRIEAATGCGVDCALFEFRKIGGEIALWRKNDE